MLANNINKYDNRHKKKTTTNRKTSNQPNRRKKQKKKQNTSLADFTSVGPFPSVRAVVHLESRLARQHFVANDALIRIGQLVTEAVDKMFQPVN